MTKSYRVKLTNGTTGVILAHSPSAARDAAYSWLCYRYRDEPVYIASVEAIHLAREEPC